MTTDSYVESVVVVQDRLDHVHPREEPADHGDDSGVDHGSGVGTEPSPLDDGDDESGGDQRVDGKVEGHGRKWERIAVEHQVHTRDHVGDQVAAQRGADEDPRLWRHGAKATYPHQHTHRSQ